MHTAFLGTIALGKIPRNEFLGSSPCVNTLILVPGRYKFRSWLYCLLGVSLWFVLFKPHPFIWWCISVRYCCLTNKHKVSMGCNNKHLLGYTSVGCLGFSQGRLGSVQCLLFIAALWVSLAEMALFCLSPVPFLVTGIFASCRAYL